MDELEYLTETLPEIVIREHLSIHDIMSENPGFVALDDDYIEAFSGELLGDTSKGIAFLELHKRCLKRAVKSLIPYARFTVAARRQNNETGDYFDKLNELRKVDYHIAQAELDRIVAVFDTSDTNAAPTDGPLLDGQRAEVQLENEDMAVVLPTDRVKLPVTTMSWQPLAWTSESHVFDTAPPTPPTPPPSGVTLTSDLEGQLRQFMPKITDLLKEVTDLHTLKVILEANAFDFERLSEDHLNMIRQLKYTDDDDNDNDFISKFKSAASKSPYSFKDSFNGYSQAIGKYLERVDNYMSDSRYATLQQAYDVYMSNAGGTYNVLEGFPSHFVLAHDLMRGSITLDQAQQALTDLRVGLNTHDVRSFIQGVLKFSKDTAEGLISKIDEIHVQDSELVSWRTSLVGHHEIHEIRKGNDTSMYEGLSTVESIFTGAVEDAADDAADDADPNFPAYSEDAEPSDTTHGIGDTVRSPDHIVNVIQRIKELTEKTGLPWDADAWLSKALQYYIFPASRFSQLKALAQNTAETVLADIAAAANKEDGMAIISRISNMEDAKQLHEGYPGIFKEWAATCDALFFDGVVYWALDTLELSISGMLDRRNFTEDPETWSPAGPPLETRTASRGVFVYIAGLISHPTEDLIKHAKDRYTAKLNSIHDIWLANGKTANTKVDETNQAFVNALTDYKTAKKQGQLIKPEFFVPTYVPQYLNLPNAKAQKIPDSKQAAWAKGCCLARLDDKYEGDIDFREKSENLYKVKMRLSDKRWLKTKRPPMLVLPLPASAPAPAVYAVAPVQAVVSQTIFTAPDLQEALTDISRSAVVPQKPELLHMLSAMKLQRDPNRMLLSILESNYDVAMYISMGKYVSRIANSAYKQRLGPDLPAAVVKYLILTMLMQLSNKTQRADTIKELFKMMNNFDIPTPVQVQEYINKQREAIKQIKVSKLDVMSKDDKLTELYSSRMGLSSYVDVLEELQRQGAPATVPSFPGDVPYSGDGDGDGDGGGGEDDEFAPRDRDADDGADDYYKY
jgi:hypothetical protein